MTKLIWVAIVLFILLFFFLLIIFTKLTITINYFHHNDDDDVKIEFRIWFGLIKYKKKIPLIKIDDDSPTIVVKSTSHLGESSDSIENTEHDVTQIGKKDIMTKLRNAHELMERVINLNVIVQKFLKKVSIKHFEWHTFFGAGDAAHTGVLTGAIWGIKGGMVGFISHFLRFKVMPNLSVTPHFQATVIQTHLKCMIQFRIGHAILAGLKLIKFWKGGRPHFKSSSNFSKEKTKSV